jgi:hypothetical protein
MTTIAIYYSPINNKEDKNMNEDIFANLHIENQARKLHATAKNGIMKHSGIRYELIFDSYYGVYSIKNNENEEIIRFNTRKITIAKQWLKEYLTN